MHLVDSAHAAAARRLLLVVAVVVAGSMAAAASIEATGPSAAGHPIGPSRVERVFRSTGFVVLRDIAERLPRWVVMDLSFTTRKTGRLVNGNVTVYTTEHRARQKAAAERPSCFCRTLRVRNVVLAIPDLARVKPAPPPHYTSDTRALAAALAKLGRPVSP